MLGSGKNFGSRIVGSGGTSFPEPINVLDHGFIRLVDRMGSDLSVVRAARVSYDAAWRSGEDTQSDRKLVNYLWSHRHTTPFEAVTFTFEVFAPIFIFRQWHRHRTFSYNELSARYKELPEVFYVPDPKMVGVQSLNNKQGRDTDHGEHGARIIQCELLRTQNQHAFKLYKKLLEDGWPRELARSVLPVSTYSHMFCTANLLNLFRFIELRSHEHAQHEIRVYSDAMLHLISSYAPICVEAFKRSGNSTNKVEDWREFHEWEEEIEHTSGSQFGISSVLARKMLEKIRKFMGGKKPSETRGTS